RSSRASSSSRSYPAGSCRCRCTSWPRCRGATQKLPWSVSFLGLSGQLCTCLDDVGNEPVAVDGELDLVAHELDEVLKLGGLRDHPWRAGEGLATACHRNEDFAVVLGLLVGVVHQVHVLAGRPQLLWRHHARVEAEDVELSEAQH